MNERTIINPKLLELIDKVFDNVDDQKCALTYAACIELDTLDTLYSWGVFKDVSDEHKFRVALMERDIEGDTLQPKYKLRYPLFVNSVEEDLFDVYHKALVMRFKTLPQSSRLFGNAKTREAFKALQMRHKDFDVQRMIDATINYYIKEEFTKNLDGFLNDLGDTKYLAWEKQKSKIL